MVEEGVFLCVCVCVFLLCVLFLSCFVSLFCFLLFASLRGVGPACFWCFLVCFVVVVVFSLSFFLCCDCVVVDTRLMLLFRSLRYVVDVVATLLTWFFLCLYGMMLMLLLRS